jgi:hypothetical protein
MTDNREPTEALFLDWFAKRSRFTQNTLMFTWIWGVFVCIPLIVTYVVYSERAGFRKWCKEMYIYYKTEFWQFREEMKQELKEFQSNNTKLHRMLK